jgi:hypothetical protein
MSASPEPPSEMPGGPWAPPPAAPDPVAQRPRPSAVRQALAALAVAVVVAGLGAGLGLLWAKLAPGVPIVKTADGAVYAEPSPEEFIAADGWFTLLGLAFGVLASVASWVLLRRYRGPLAMLAVVAGTVGAGWLAWRVGREVGLEEFHRAVDAATAGQLIVRPPDLRAGGIERLWGVIPYVRGDLLMPAFGAVVAYTLLAGWSRYASLGRETEPRYVVEPDLELARESEPEPGAPPFSWGSPAPQAPAVAPAPPAPDATAPPRD